MNPQGTDTTRTHTYNAMWQARQDDADRTNDALSWQAELNDLRNEIRACTHCKRGTTFGPRGECPTHMRELADHYEYRPW